MSKHVKWLLSELDRWLVEGLITGNQAEALRRRYAEKTSPSWGTILFSGIGAILFGCGVILLFAYNWERIPKFGKLGIVFGALFASHGAALFLQRPGGRHPVLGEALHVLGTMLFGAGIWLVAQIYHIQEHFPNAFLIWGCGALVMGWALRSAAHGIVAVVLFVLWNGFEGGYFENANPFAPPLILLTLAPLAWTLRSRALSGTVTAGLLVALIFSVGHIGSRLLLPVLFSVACCLIALGLIVRKYEAFSESAPVLFFFGNGTYWIALYMLSFPAALRSILNPVDFQNPAKALYFTLSATAALAAWVIALWPPGRFRDHRSTFLRLDHLLVPAALLVLIPQAGWMDGLGWVGAGIFNLIFIVQCFSMIRFGSGTANIRFTAAGCVLFALLAAARYTDLFHSLIVRGLVFLVVGAVVFGVGIYYSRTKKQLETS